MITAKTLAQFAYTNDQACTRPIKAVALEFHGLNSTAMLNGMSAFSAACARKGVLCIFPYYGPWSWMNDTAVRFTDAVVTAAYDKYHLNTGIPLISTGGSMGGLSALIYTRYAKKTPVACAANCPVCDLPYHLTERDDLPRTLYHAFGHYPCSFHDALESASPIHQVRNMPRIPYYIVHCDQDIAVNKQRHSDVFVDKMTKENHSVIYDIVPDQGHCQLTEEAFEKYLEFVFSFT